MSPPPLSSEASVAAPGYPKDLPAPAEIAIKAENLSKCYLIYERPRDRLLQMLARRWKTFYREFWALRDVSFEIRRGETVGIIGRNGSGKSTLLQLICGTLHPTGGNVQTHGRVAALLELGSGFNPEFTGRENVYMNAALLGLTRAQTDQRFDAIAAFADIGEFIDRPTKTYSSGMMVRLAFSVIAHVDADILIIDEALAVGDAFFTQKCMRFLRTFMRTGTILFVSHDTASVRSLCNRAIWLERGKMVREGSPKDVCENYLEAFYGVTQGKGRAPAQGGHAEAGEPSRVVKDQRDDYINHSNLRNDLEVFTFDPDAAAFGQGGATITTVEFLDKDGCPLAWMVGGEEVCLHIQAAAHDDLDSPIVGFFIKDRFGQTLFGDNTYLSRMDAPVACPARRKMDVKFFFQMPRLAAGDYSVTVAIANGTQQDHVQHHWIHDALHFRSESTSVAAGMVGIPMRRIDIESI